MISVRYFLFGGLGGKKVDLEDEEGELQKGVLIGEVSKMEDPEEESEEEDEPEDDDDWDDDWDEEEEEEEEEEPAPKKKRSRKK